MATNTEDYSDGLNNYDQLSSLLFSSRAGDWRLRRYSVSNYLTLVLILLMPLFEKKDQNLIPAVTPPASTPNTSSPRPAYHHTYVPSRDGDPYNSPISRSASAYSASEESASLVDKYNRNRGIGDVYARGGAELESDRNELFSGYNPPQKSGSGRFFDGSDTGRDPTPGEEKYEDIEGIKQQTHFVKQESVNSTRNALRMARDAEETARHTLTRLGDQSGKFLFILFGSAIDLFLQRSWRTLSVISTLLRATPNVQMTKQTNLSN